MATTKLTAKQKLAMLIDENEMPKPPPPAVMQPAVVQQDDPIHGLSQAQMDYWNYEDNQDDDDENVAPKSNDQDNDSSPASWPPRQPSHSEFASMTGNHADHEVPPMGTLAAAGEKFVPIVALSKFPYKFISNKTLGQRIASGFFDQAKFWRYHWEICYVWPPGGSFSEVVLLVSKYQVECLIDSINKEVKGACPSLTTIDSTHGLILTFRDPHPDLRPRYLGRITSQDEFQQIKKMVPNSSFRPSTERRDFDPPSIESKHALKLLLEHGSALGKAKGKSKPKAVREHQMYLTQQDHKRDLKEAERFFGLRPPYFDEQAKSNEPWSAAVERDARRDAAEHPPSIDPTKLPPYAFASSAILIAFDVESYERDTKKVTEVGVSTLDTLDLAGTAPDVHGSAWRDKIRSRHFRIKEHAHLMNGDFVAGNAGDFRFGESEFIHLDDAPTVLATCFRFPFSASESQKQRLPKDATAEDKRTIVLVGHDFNNDIRYMRNLGYDVTNLSNLSKHAPILDTQGMYRVMKGDKDPAKLAKLLDELDIIPWGLHNAGNDARYTMEALIGIVVDKASQRRGTKAAPVDAVAEKVDGLSMK